MRIKRNNKSESKTELFLVHFFYKKTMKIHTFYMQHDILHNIRKKQKMNDFCADLLNY